MPVHARGVSWVFSQNSGAAILGEDLQAPIFILATVGNGNDDIIVLLYNETLDTGSVPAIGDFSLAGTAETVASVAINARRVSLTLTGVVLETETILLDYTAGANPIQDVAGNDALDLTNEAVTNNTQAYMRDSYGDLVLDSYGDPIPLPH